MPIKPTTPTSAGFAQAFDTSGLVQIAAAQKAKRDKRLADMAIEYDTKGVFKRDIPYIQKKISEFENFTLQNQNKLTNPSKHMDVYREWSDMKNGIKNTITYSISAKEGHNRALQMLGTDRYTGDYNASVIDAYSQTPTEDQYENLSAWEDVQKFMKRNTKLDPKKYADIAKEKVFDLSPEMGGQLTSEKGIYKKGKGLKREDVAAALESSFFGGSLEAGDLRYTYGEGEDGFNRFVDDTMRMVDTSPEYQVFDTGSASTKADDAASAKADAFIMEREGSGSYLTEQPYIMRDMQIRKVSGVKTETYKASDGQYYTQTELQAQNEARKKAAESEKKDFIPIEFDVTKDMSTDKKVWAWGPSLVGNKTLSVYNVPVKKPIREAYNMSSGEMASKTELRYVTQQIVREVGVYKQAKYDMNIRITDPETGKSSIMKIEKGSVLPDFVKMKNENAIDDVAWAKFIANSKPFQGAVVMSVPESVNFFQMAPAAQNEWIENNRKAGQESFIVPLEHVQGDIDQYGQWTLKDKYTPLHQKMAESGMFTTQPAGSGNNSGGMTRGTRPSTMPGQK